jgi:steroid delta-isomerase-like uncharacterized protein
MSLPPTRTTTNLLALALAIAACTTTSTRRAAMPDTIPETVRNENKRNVDRLFAACFNQGDLGLLDQLVSPEYVGPQDEHGPAGFRGIVVGLRTAFPDIHYTVDDVIAENDKVAVRWHWSGTHEAPFRAHPASHHKVSSTGAGIFRFRHGKIVAATLETDRLGFLQQLGVVPPDAVLNAPQPPQPPQP